MRKSFSQSSMIISEFHLTVKKTNYNQMKLRKIIPVVLILMCIIFSQCKSCDCSYQPKKASVKQTWVKK